MLVLLAYALPPSIRINIYITVRIVNLMGTFILSDTNGILKCVMFAQSKLAVFLSGTSKHLTF